MAIPSIRIGDRHIGSGYPVYIVAELSANHCQKFEQAVALVKEAKEAGADAVKLQTYTPDTMTIDSTGPEFRIDGGTPWDGKTLYELYDEAFMPWEWQPKLKAIADEEGIDLFSTPFDKSAVDFLCSMNVQLFKVASFEITDIPLIEYIASQGKPVIISTGIATLPDIEDAVGACRKMGNTQISLLKCTSAYPAPLEEANLRTIPHLAERFGVVVGLSDHTLGVSVPISAVCVGACIIEKHLTLDRKLGGPDASFSLEPNEFKAMVAGVREAEIALGEVTYKLTEKAAHSRNLCRSLFVVEDIKKGEILTEANVRSIRPGYGLHPKYLPEIYGRKAKIDMKKGTPLQWSAVQD